MTGLLVALHATGILLSEKPYFALVQNQNTSCCPQETSRKEGRRGKVNVFLDFLTMNGNQFLLFMIFLTVAFFSK